MLPFPARRLLQSNKLVLLIACLLTLPIALAVPFRPDHWDGSIFAYVGQQWARGVIPYAQLFDNKPPGIFLLNALGACLHHTLGFVGIAYFASTVTGVLLLGVMLKNGGAPPEIGGLGIVVASVLMNLRIYTAGDMPESFMFCPAAASMLLFFRYAQSGQLRRVFLAGLFAGTACLFKPFALAAIAAEVAFVILRFPAETSRKLQIIGLILAGAVAAWIPFLVYFHLHGALATMLDASFFYNLHYGVASLRLRNSARLLNNLWRVSPAIIAVALGLGFSVHSPFFRESRRGALWLLSVIWLLAGFVLIAGVGRGFEQYVLSLLPAASLCVTLFVWYAAEISSERHLTQAILALVLIPLLSAYVDGFRPFRQAALDAQAPDTRTAAELKRIASPTDTILVWGYEPWIPYTTELRSASRFTSSYFIYDSSKSYRQVGSELLYALDTHPPTWIVLEQEALNEAYEDEGVPSAFTDDPVKRSFVASLQQSYVDVWSDPAIALYRHK